MKPRKFQIGDRIRTKYGDDQFIYGRVVDYVKCVDVDTFLPYERPLIEWEKPSIIFVRDAYNEKHLELVERPQPTLFEGAH